MCPCMHASARGCVFFSSLTPRAKEIHAQCICINSVLKISRVVHTLILTNIYYMYTYICIYIDCIWIHHLTSTRVYGCMCAYGLELMLYMPHGADITNERTHKRTHAHQTRHTQPPCSTTIRTISGGLTAGHIKYISRLEILQRSLARRRRLLGMV